jgi:RNA polymerase sigma-70 factor (ECF subfamily)
MPKEVELDPTEWLEKHGDILFRYAISRVRDAAAAEDLVQETFLAGIKSRESFSGRSTERTWLVGILKHKVVDYIRKDSRQTLTADIENREQNTEEYFDRKGTWKVGPSEWLVNPQKAFERGEFWEVLHGCVEHLKDKQKEVFIKRELESLEADEICEELEISSSNLWVLLFRARAQLKKCLEVNWLEKVENE